MPKDADGLSPRHRKFVDAYLLDPHGARAAIAAGYSKNGADSRASQLLVLVKIRKVIDKARADAAAKSTVDLDLSLEGHLRRLARLGQLAIDSGDLKSAVLAEATIGKHSGAAVITKRHEMAGAGGGPVTIVHRSE